MAAVGISVYHRIYSTKVWVRRPNKGMEAPPIMAFYCLQLGGLKPPPLGGSFSRFFVSLEA